jgi:hypothetical protein
MKRLPHLLASASFLLAVSLDAGAGNVDLAVHGSITPAAACDVSTGSAALELGKIDRATLNEDPSKYTDLEEKRVLTSVTCPSARRFAFVVTEARGGNAAKPLVFDMHDAIGDAKPGNLLLLFDAQSTKIDGEQGYATGSGNGVGDLGQETWGPSTSPRENLPITNGRYAVGFVKSAGSTDAPVPMETLSVYLLVRPRIKPVNELDLSRDIAFSSDLGLEIRYF